MQPKCQWFCRKLNFKRNLITHTGMKPYLCRNCDMALAKKSYCIAKKIYWGEATSILSMWEDFCRKLFLNIEFVKHFGLI